MDNISQDADTAFEFEGTWQEFAPIAFTNLLLTIVTLGIYRFWATARERRYLWSRSRFIDERLEWAGTGLELFLGFLIVLVLFVLPFTILNFVLQGAIFQDQPWIAGIIFFGMLLFIFYLTGVARFRALRYRLARTRWHGIRGGSDDPGLKFGLSYMWKTFVGYLPAGLLVPWSMTSLWNERWSKMSFGPLQFKSDASASEVFARYLLFYLAPIVFFIALIPLTFAGVASGFDGEAPGAGFILAIFAFIFLFYFGLGLIAVAFYAKFYREAVGATQLGNLQFHFGASTMDWIKLLLGDVLLVVLTLGIGWIFLSYRHWKFFITHIKASGEVRLDELTQSTTATSKHGEGLLDAFDVGAI